MRVVTLSGALVLAAVARTPPRRAAPAESAPEPPETVFASLGGLTLVNLSLERA